MDKARLLNPVDGNPALDLAFLYDEIGRFDEAESLYQIARERDPKSAATAGQYEAHQRAWSDAKPTTE